MSEYRAVLREDELEGGAMLAVEIDGEQMLLSRSENGEVCTISNTCTHMGGPLNEGERNGDVVTCPWHGSQFDLCSGKVEKGPAREPQRRYGAQVNEGQVEVRAG